MIQTNKRSAEIANRVRRVALRTGLKTPSIYRILRGDRDNEEVFTIYMELLEVDKAIDKMDSPLLDAVKELVPTNY